MGLKRTWGRFTRQPNELYTLLAEKRLTTKEFVVLSIAIRYTEGIAIQHNKRKEEAALSSSFVAKAAGISRPTAIKTIDSLILKGYLQDTEKTWQQCKVYRVVWDEEPKTKGATRTLYDELDLPF